MNNHENWYKTFFNGLAVELWHNIPTPAFTESEVNFIKEISGIGTGGKVLDVPCGSGRHTLALAEQGFQLTGIDISPENIRMLKAAAGSLSVNAVCADIMEYNIEGAYDVAICMGNSFSYFPYDGLVRFAAKVCNALKSGGIFIVNSGAIAESLLPSLKEESEMTVGDIIFKLHNTYITETKLLQTDMQFIKGTEVECKTAYHFVFTLAELKAILTSAGFSSVQVFGCTDQSEYKPEKGQAYFVAIK